MDLSTSFGIVYQVKKLRIHNESEAEQVYAELKVNFHKERLRDGNVLLIIDDISKEVEKFLIDMKMQSISKHDILKLAADFEDPQDRQKMLRVVYDEFHRDYSTRIR